MNENILTTKEEVSKITTHILSSGLSSGIDTYYAPPLDRSKYEYLGYWEQGQWQVIQNCIKAKELSIDSPVISLYMEDETSTAISPGVKNTLQGDLFSYWNDIHETGEVLKKFTELGLKRKDHFRAYLEIKYPWLHLCKAHWKVDHLWINHFRSWKKPRLSPTLEPGANTTPNKEATDPKLLDPIPTSDRAEPGTPMNASSSPQAPGIGSKRGREGPDDLDNPLKRRKGKEREIFTPTNFHHTHPIPRRFVGKITKVSKSCIYPP